MNSDLDLLRRFEPVLRFTRGENFFPMDVEEYVSLSSLWAQYPGQDPECVIPQGELSLERLAEPLPGGPGVVYFLRFIEPLDILKLLAFVRQRYMKSHASERFQSGLGRLARVGYSSRFADLLFSLSLLLRGRVPGDTSAAASIEYKHILGEKESYSYHGRVIHQSGWIVLQYWYFYAFNNWRSGFFGVNDHEGDWEMVNVYLYEAAAGNFKPEWVAYASHDFSGDDLRRRWDDPELQKVDDHPIVYAAAGSHASYYSAGEYLAEIELPFLSPLARGFNSLGKTWSRMMGRRQETNVYAAHNAGVNVLRVPFVDYARGDGLSIGAQSAKEWGQPRLLGTGSPDQDASTGWVSNYSGLWGLFARDPISGENAPAGPMYNRGGTIRRVWYDPLGWAGLDKVAPPNLVLQRVREEQAALRKGLDASAEEIEYKTAELARLGVISSALQTSAEWLALQNEQHSQTAALAEELAERRQQHAASEKRLAALRFYEQRLLNGEKDPLRAHIRRAHVPASDTEMRINRLVELWAALSIGLLMIGFVAIALFYRQHLILGLVVLISLFVFIESGFRRQLDQLINSVAIGLAVVAALVVLFHFFWWIAVLAVLSAGIYILWENLRELTA
jgi:hypothetical protein